MEMLEPSWIYTIPLQPSTQFYYVIVMNLTRFKASVVSYVNVYQLITIYIKKQRPFEELLKRHC